MLRLLQRFISLSLSAVAVLIVSGLLSLKPVSEPPAQAHHADTPSCRDLYGVTTSVNSPATQGRRANIADSGRIDFNTPTIVHDFETCREDVVSKVKVSGNSPINGRAVRGWAWNTNLGYLSFYCQGGANFATGNCGAIDYGTVLQQDPLQPSKHSRVRGLAWGDNIGWISMGCDNGSNAGITTVNCGQDYGVYVAMQDGVDAISFDCTGQSAGRRLLAGQMFGYAWSDTVGWINFCGARMPVPGIGNVLNFDNTCPTCEPGGVPSVGPGGAPGPGAVDPNENQYKADTQRIPNRIYANGFDTHEIQVYVRQNGQLIDKATLNLLDVRVKLANDPAANINTVRLNQITPCTSASPGCPGDAVDSQFDTTKGQSDLKWDSSGGYFYLKMTSQAPTNSNNQLKIGKLEYEYTDPATITLPPLQQTRIMRELIVNYDFEFVAPLRVTAITADDGTESFTAVANRSSRLQLRTRREGAPLDTNGNPDKGSKVPRNDQIKVVSQLFDCSVSPSNHYDFFFDTNGDGLSNGTSATTDDDDVVNIQRIAPIPSAQLVRQQGAPNYCTPQPTSVQDALWFDIRQAPTYTSSTYIYSKPVAGARLGTLQSNVIGLQTIISYQTTSRKLVQYYSRHLGNSSVVNQAATIRGDVRSDVVDPAGLGSAVGRISQSIGERAQSKREPFYRVIKTMISEQVQNFAGGLNQINLTARFEMLGSRELNIPLQPTLPRSKFIYLRRDQRLTNPATGSQIPCHITLDGLNPAANVDINFTGNTTIISEGCDIYIDRNIITKGTTANGGRLGIIALEDLSMSGTTRRGGNLYICSKVTDIEANIVLDGSVFSYGQSDSECGNKDLLVNAVSGLPEFRGATPMRDILKRQLTLTGSLISNNTYGGSLKQPPILGTGKTAESAQEMADARLYDINFLRWAHVKTPLQSDNCPPNTREMWLNTQQELSKTFPIAPGQSLCAANNPGDRSIVNIFYSAPGGEMPVFREVK